MRAGLRIVVIDNGRKRRYQAIETLSARTP
jgi:hypothetical protein